MGQGDDSEEESDNESEYETEDDSDVSDDSDDFVCPMPSRKQGWTDYLKRKNILQTLNQRWDCEKSTEIIHAICSMLYSSYLVLNKDLTALLTAYLVLPKHLLQSKA